MHLTLTLAVTVSVSCVTQSSLARSFPVSVHHGVRRVSHDRAPRLGDKAKAA